MFPRADDSKRRLQSVTLYTSCKVACVFWPHKVTYRELRHIFGLDDRLLTEICDALLFKRVAMAEGNRGLVWTSEVQLAMPPVSRPGSQLAVPDVTLALSPTAPAVPPPFSEPDTLTKGPPMVLSSDLLREDAEQYVLTGPL